MVRARHFHSALIIMKIGDPNADRPEVQLPIEVVELIISFTTRKSAWACCLVSHQWYSATIAKLYERPRLDRSNFDKFAATICPPVNAHVRRIGLEHHVKHLNMSAVAYESTNSLTARLLRRVGPSLDVFIAPPTSFSTSCLAPLAKCEQLRVLDLSLAETHSFSRTALQSVLSHIHKLKHLISFSLSPVHSVGYDDLADEKLKWPPSLSDLQFNGAMPASINWWETVASRWPESLQSLTFYDCKNFDPLYQMNTARMVFSRISSLTVEVKSTSVLPMNIAYWLHVFPSLRFLNIPVFFMDGFVLLNDAELVTSASLEQLELTQVDDEVRRFHHRHSLSYVVSRLTGLWQLRIHEPAPDLTTDWQACDDADTLLKQRAKTIKEAAGLVQPSLEDAGVVYVSD